MRIDSSHYSIAEIREMLDRRDLVINRQYQRGSRLWPVGPRSYFIETILTGFPFPNIYFYEFLDMGSRKTRRELVDGQQRILAITDFVDGKYQLSRVSDCYLGKKFGDLGDDEQTAFLSYSVPVDVIRSAEKADILQMFRRMNAYTLPLNEAEKRHSTFQGEFKWMINKFADSESATFVEYEILTNRQIVRMADAELLADMCLALDDGIISSSPSLMKKLYERYDAELTAESEFENRLAEFFRFVQENLGGLRGTHIFKSYVVHSLFCAAMHNKYGLPGADEILELEPIGTFSPNLELAVENLRALATAHETNDIEGEFAEYVWGCSAATTRLPRRTKRVKALAGALRGH